jgi:myo-inositol 2-dehydrogenase/D-chiro-inositol 1-dehydrogenase
MNEVGIGLIGCGEIAAFHAQALLRTGQARIAATCDLAYEKAQTLADAHGGQPYRTVDELLADPAVDAVYVLTHHDTHAAISIRCLEAGKHVFCEKPLAMSLEDALQVGGAARRSGQQLMVGFNHRWNPAVARVHDLIGERKAHIRCLQLTFATSPFLASWGGLAGVGGGVLPCLGSHAIDLACYLMGSEPVRIQAMTARLRLADPYLEDTAAILLEFEHGGIASLCSHDHAPLDYTAYATGDPSRLVRAEVFADGWAALIEHSHCVNIYEGEPRTIHLYTADPLEILGIGPEDASFVHSLVNATPVIPDVLDGIRAVRWVELALAAARLGKAQSQATTRNTPVKNSGRR